MLSICYFKNKKHFSKSFSNNFLKWIPSFHSTKNISQLYITTLFFFSSSSFKSTQKKTFLTLITKIPWSTRITVNNFTNSFKNNWIWRDKEDISFKCLNIHHIYLIDCYNHVRCYWIHKSLLLSLGQFLFLVQSFEAYLSPSPWSPI